MCSPVKKQSTELTLKQFNANSSTTLKMLRGLESIQHQALYIQLNFTNQFTDIKTANKMH